MKPRFLILIFIFLCLHNNCISYPKSFPIDQAIIKDSIRITITGEYIRDKKHIEKKYDAPIILEPYIFFNLSKLGLKNSKNPLILGDWMGAPIDWYHNYSSFKSYPDIIYNITILNLKTNKSYYGKIEFIEAENTKITKGKPAATDYYQIQIPDSKFSEATNGRVSCIYEWYAGYEFNIKEYFVTWVIWFSDTPL